MHGPGSPPHNEVKTNNITAGAVTHEEIFSQPFLWQTTMERMRGSEVKCLKAGGPVIVTGAGSSAYAAAAIAVSWPGARAIPTTDLLLYTDDELRDALPHFAENGLLISLARSGNSPESVGVVAKFRRLYPRVKHLVITCNADGQLAQNGGVERIVLDPRTNDRSLAMTSSFSNLTLAGLALRHSAELSATAPQICQRVREALPLLDAAAKGVADSRIERMTILASTGLQTLATEGALKILELSGGYVFAMPESFLGLRHGPMSFLRADSVTVCFLSSNPHKRQYEADLIRELRKKSLGRIVVIGADGSGVRDVADVWVAANAPDLPDFLRVPFEIPFVQLLAYHLSLARGFNPDNPSPAGVITRVVENFRVYEDFGDV